MTASEVPLTLRQMQVLFLVAEGAETPEIAEALNISKHTAHTHVGKVLRRLGAHTRAEAVAIGFREGYLR